MDTRYSRDIQLQSQNNSPHLNVHFQPNIEASSTSLLRPDEQNGQYTHGNAKKLKRQSALAHSVFIEIALCILVLGFLAFAALAIWMNDSPTGTAEGDRIEQAMKVGSTIYSIVFAALLSRSLKNIGRYKAQKGTRLMSLWTLMNTNTVSDPVSHIFTKPITLLVSCLVFLWALSPLGSQSTLRLVYPFNSTSVSHHAVRYLDTGPLGNLFPYAWSCTMNEGAYPISTRDMYLAALMQSLNAKKGQRDQWGNVKIPRLPDPTSSTADPDGWFPAPKGTVNPEQYSSLSGIPIVGLADLAKKEINFTVETSYVELSCSGMNYNDDITEDGFEVACADCGQECSPDASGRTGAFLGSPFSGLTAAQQANATITRSRSISFNSTALGNGQGSVQTTCQVRQRLVETLIECIGSTCAASKIRASRTDHRSANYTSFDYWGTVALGMISRSTMTDYVTNPGVGYILRGPSTSELFLNDSNILPTPSNQILLSEGEVFNLSSISVDLFATRASTLLNTALQVFMCPSCFAGDFPSNLTLYGPDHVPADGLAVATKAFNWTLLDAFEGRFDLINQNIPFMAASTNATVTSRTEVYRPSYPWIGVLVGSVAVVFLLGVSGLCLRFATIIPNVFDPVIGLTYSNKYMLSTSLQGLLDSEDRVKSVPDERVRFGAVEHKDLQARVTFGEEAMVSPVNKETWYYESSHT